MSSDGVAKMTAHRPARWRSTGASLAGASRVTRPGAGRSGRRVGALLAWFIVMLAFTAFFVVPVIWVIIAPTKTDHQLVYENPLAFGAFHTFLKTWEEIYAFQGRELMTWLGNSAKYRSEERCV